MISPVCKVMVCFGAKKIDENVYCDIGGEYTKEIKEMCDFLKKTECKKCINYGPSYALSKVSVGFTSTCINCGNVEIYKFYQGKIRIL